MPKRGPHGAYDKIMPALCRFVGRDKPEQVYITAPLYLAKVNKRFDVLSLGLGQIYTKSTTDPRAMIQDFWGGRPEDLPRGRA